ncbi:hypothetical protein D0T84_19945 [Dysgonomonas sp. 521]|uniref:DUF6493 family protein n=1 Tax=Dysgonomonas sp. 521 TaxID=2302932 RepID=UPI0013D0BE71|nr:DUF6493 family protein [Dysgonomonas sp. 521]NDV97156.1 hypothetical protein [Dysgonomonas sp. 521]
MKDVIELIKERDYRKILKWATALTDEERYKYLEQLKTLDVDTEIIKEPRPEKYNRAYYDNRALVDSTRSFMQICCLRSSKDLRLTAPEWNKSWSLLHYYIQKPLFGVEPLIEYFKIFRPDYLDKIIKDISAGRESNNDFQMLWQLYKNGFIDFDEEIFVRSLFIIPMFNRDTMKDVRFLSETPEAVGKVLLQFYKYEIPILDISKWQAKKEYVCKKCFEYWEEVFRELLEANLITDRAIVRNLLSTLTYSWKKGHLDWHIRMLKLFNPTKEEYLANQDYLYAALYSTNSTVGNFVVSTAQSLYKEKDFDAEAFIQGIPNLLNKEKSDKAILTALDIVSYLLDNTPAYRKYTDIPAGALVQPNDKIQEKVALMLVKYADKKDLKEIVEPFAAALKQKALDILGIDKGDVEGIQTVALENYPLSYPSGWEDFLFHIGKTLGSLEPSDIDIMYESLIQMQDTMPDDYQSQLKPYTKKLEKASSEKELLLYIAELFDNWLHPEKSFKTHPSFWNNRNNPNPFMRHRNKWVLSKLRRNVKLPLLSSPSHYPFYVHPSILVSRLSEYERAGEAVEIEDLIVACNRILKTDISDKTGKEAKELKGYYAKAIHYLLGLTDKIDLDDKTLPLWAAITRTTDANGIFNEFEATQIKDYPVAVNPFRISYTIERDYSKSGEYHWDRLILEDNWSYSYNRNKKKGSYPSLYFYTAHNGMEFYSKTGMLYWLSLVPHYCDAVLLRYLPDTASGNEVAEFEYCLYPLQFLIENQIRVHHNGWLYIALCLIFEKKVSRELAAEYINMAFDLDFIDKEFLSENIAYMIMNMFAPVNRLIEYFDQPYPDHIREFQLSILKKCIEKADKKSLPTNFKKITAYYVEICNQLKIEIDNQIGTRMKELKK